MTLPSVVALQSQAESFLQAAKSAIRETGRLVGTFYQEKFDHRYHKIKTWAEQQFGEEDALTQAVTDWERWVKTVIEMRNAVDHPSDKPMGKLVTEDFRLVQADKGYAVSEPRWGLSGGQMRPIVQDMTEIIEGIIELGEEMLAGLFFKLKHDFPLSLYEIPAEERDPKCPIRLRVNWAQKD